MKGGRPLAAIYPSCMAWGIEEARANGARFRSADAAVVTMPPKPKPSRSRGSAACRASRCRATVIAVAFFCLLFYAASLILQPLQLVGISQIPPGIAYYDYRQGRF